jgi:hypothetical protein
MGESLIWGYFASIVCYIITLVCADLTAEKFQKHYDLDGISIPQPFCQSFVPFAVILNKALDYIPGFSKLDIDAEGMKKKFGVLGEPLVLGRTGEGTGIKFWADTIKQHGEEKAATWFVQQAKDNYQKGVEKTFNYLDPAQLLQQAKGMISETITTRNEVIKSTGGTVISTRPVQHIVNATNYEGIAILS